MTIYAATDTETWGFDNERKFGSKYLAQISIVIEDTDTTKDIPVWMLPNFTAIVDPEGVLSGEVDALSMNSWILAEIRKSQKNHKTKYPVMPISSIIHYATTMLRNYKTSIYPVGQNYGTFDSYFLPEDIRNAMHYRAIEISSVFMAPGEAPLGLGSIKQSLGFDKTVTHNAYHEAMDYILLLRTKYNGNLTPYNKENT